MSPLLAFLLSFNIFLSIAGHPIDFPEDDFFERAFSFDDVEETFADIEPKEYRLKTTVKPSFYAIELEPYFNEDSDKNFTFRGNVKITLKAQEAGVKEIEIHADQLNIEKITLKDETGNDVNIEEHTYQNETQKIKIPVSVELNSTINYILEIDYTGVLNDAMKGFYRSYYNEEGKKVWLASTQFQQTSFRRACPSFDEPLFKAQFQLTVIRPLGYQLTLTNTNVEEQIPIEESGKVKEVFKKTPVMSSYLMAFVVQMFKGLQTKDKTYGVWARPEAESQLNYSLTVGEKLLKEMGTWMDYPFNTVPEIQKLDMIAVPDFSAGAMENWGAMTYRETALLWDENESSATNKQRIAAVLTHEMAHLWFGDLVTCEWWGTTWLNEGFARYFQYFGTHLVEKTWDLPYQFVVEQLQGVFTSDSLPGTYPMTNPNVYTPAQASAMFGSVSYNKGASIIRMIEHHMKTANFKKALQQYLKDNQYKTVKPEDLFAAFDKQSPDAKVSEVFTAWTNQSGYPVLTVTSHENDTIKVTQNRFLLNEKENTDKTKWTIPITYANQAKHFDDTTTKVTFPSSQTGEFSIDLPAKGTLGFYILNVQQVGYYRVNYDEENWNAIGQALRTEDFGKIHVLNRAQIVDDLFNFARNGLLSYDYVMPIVDYIKAEKNYIPWLSYLNGLSHVSKRIGLGSDYERFKTQVLQLTEGLYQHLGFEPNETETHIDTLSRANLLTWMCKHGHEDCVTKAKDEFTKLKNGEGKYLVNPNIRVPVYCTAIREGNEEDFDFLWNKFLTTNVAAEEINILTALGCAKTQELINLFMEKILSDDIRSQDKSSSFTSAYTSNHENVDLVYNYLTENYEKWEKVMGNVGSALSSVADRFTTEEQVKKLEDFAKTKGLSENAVKSIKSAVESARKNIKWDEERLKEVREYFNVLDNNSAVNVKFSFSLVILSVVTYFYFN